VVLTRDSVILQAAVQNGPPFLFPGEDAEQKLVSRLGAMSDQNFVTFVLFVVTNCLTTKYTKEEMQGRNYLCKVEGKTAERKASKDLNQVRSLKLTAES